MQLEFKAGNDKDYKIDGILIAQFMPESQQNNYQGSTIWFHGKTTLKSKILRSLY